MGQENRSALRTTKISEEAAYQASSWGYRIHDARNKRGRINEGDRNIWIQKETFGLASAHFGQGTFLTS